MQAAARTPDLDNLAGLEATRDAAAAAEPDRERLNQGIVDHIASVRRYALLLVGDPNDADDLVQECLVRVVAQTQGWRGVRDIRAYMFTTLHNLFVDGHRRRKARPADLPIEAVVADLVAPAAQLGWLEVRDLVVALGRLSAEQREVVLLVGLEGMSYAEAAAVLCVPVGTVMSRLSRGREALRRLTGAEPQAQPIRLVK